MKCLSLFFILLIVSFSAFSQNWAPLTINDTFHYRLDGEQVISVTFFVQNYSTNNGDTTFTFNQIGQDSGIYRPVGPINCQTCYGLLNQPQAICGYSMLKSTAGICQINTGTSVNEIHTLGSTGNSWMFNASSNTAAQIIAEYTGTVLGQPDSLKFALLSTGDSLIWSKHHGIVQWPTGNGIYYRIAGIQNRNTGDKPPGVKDFFDFQPGDMFEYVSEHHETFQKYDYHRTKITINSRTDSGSSITYTYSGAHTAMNYDYLNNPPGNATSYLFTPVSGSFTITDSANHAANGYHHQMVSLNAAFMNTVHMLDGNSVLFTNEVWYETRHFIDSLGNYGVVIGGNDPVDSSTYTFWGTMGAKNLSSGSDTTYMVYDGINMYPSFTHTGSAYVAGLGMVRASFRTVGYPDGFIYSEKLVAYRKGNDTVGVFTPDAILLGLSTDEVLPGLVIYPNPASDYLHIETKGAFVNLVCVYDATGRLVLRHANDGLQCVVNAQTLNEGIYYVEVFTEKGKIREKLFVHR